MIAALAVSFSLGYGIANQIPTEYVPSMRGGLELRALFGGDDGDKWSVWLGAQSAKHTREGWAFKLHIDDMPAYGYVAGLRRFNLRRGNVTWFAGTGIGYRSIETCLADGYVLSSSKSHCFRGDAFISSDWAFAQELGMKWKVVELSLGHFSTGGITEINHGVNMFRFTIFGKVARHE